MEGYFVLEKKLKKSTKTLMHKVVLKSTQKKFKVYEGEILWSEIQSCNSLGICLKKKTSIRVR